MHIYVGNVDKGVDNGNTLCYIILVLMVLDVL
jgi:hypothetical protein